MKTYTFPKSFLVFFRGSYVRCKGLAARQIYRLDFLTGV
jgi:hypothetical protein